jgi:PEP-CTERM motif
MRPRHLMTALLVLSFASTALQAGPTFSISGGPPPGEGSEFGSLNYEGPNNVSDPLLATPIVGTGTPLNSGVSTFEDILFFSVNPPFDGNSGLLLIDSASTQDFTGIILSSDIGPTGGTAFVIGTLRPDFAAFYGLDPNIEYGGTLQVQLAPATPGGIGNYQGTAQFTFTAIPEPASIAMVGMGLLAVVAYGRRPLLKSCRPDIHED